MTAPALYVDQQPLRLGRRLGKGGEGDVYALEDRPTLAVKFYTVTDATAREPKVTLMIQEGLATKAPLVAFPIQIVRKHDGAFAGFLMRLVGGHKPLHELYSPGPRKHHFPQADYRFLVHTALNVARAIASVHQAGCVVGDINHSGILVSAKATVALIDADSFQISAGGKRHFCRVGVPEYTPPELQGRNLTNVERTTNNDAFGLAVVIFQLLLMGRHPFIGSVRKGELPPLHDAIRDFRYVYTEKRDVGMDQPPGTPTLEHFFPPLAAAFDAAFSKETVDRRPTASAWVSTLESLAKSLEQCDANPLHYIPRDADDCAWCEMERALHTTLFLPYVPAVSLTQAAFDPGAGGFRLEVVWARIEAVRIPASSQAPSPALNLPPSAEVEEVLRAKRNPERRVLWRAVVIIAAVVAATIYPDLTLLWIAGAALGWFAWRDEERVDFGRYQSRYVASHRALERELLSREQRAGLAGLQKLRQELVAARDAYLKLPTEEKQQVEQYRRERRQRQLHAFLDTFDIAHAKIKGVGPAKQATLASYGVDTAADVEPARVLAVPGFGPTNSKPLLAWRASLEKRFTYSDKPTPADAQEHARIRSAVDAAGASLRKKLLAGASNLEALAKRAHHVLSQPDPAVTRAQREFDQAASDLTHLGLSLPHLPAGAASSAAAQHVGQPGASPLASTGAPSCPRCSSRMIRRVAHRGRNAGRPFWGCSRYPTCVGTRNI
jgi:DNA-binding helix-hairpin-helix protein with protein kinase domain